MFIYNIRGYEGILILTMVTRLLSVLFLGCVFIFNVSAQKTYIVSVGIADYKEINDLRFTESDVNTFNQIMSHYTDEIYSLFGTQATHANIVKTIRTIFAKATPKDAVVFFFSGHGYEGGFCCYDMRAQSYIGGMTYQELQILFRNCRAGRKIVFADACFSGGVSKQRTTLAVQSVQNSNVMFFLSSRFDETSLELPEGPNGLFTYYLAKGLCGASDYNDDCIITAREIFDYVNKEVVRYTSRIPHNQHPTIWGNYNQEMSILKYR